MRRTVGAAILVSLSVACALNDPRAAENEVTQIENDWNQSRIAGDAHRVAELLDDSWTDIHVDGRIERKDSYVQGIAAGDRHILSIDVIERVIRVEPAVAVVTGEVVQRCFRRGEMREGRLRYTQVWVRRGSSWRMIRSQATEIKPQ